MALAFPSMLRERRDVDGRVFEVPTLSANRRPKGRATHGCVKSASRRKRVCHPARERPHGSLNYKPPIRTLRHRNNLLTSYRHPDIVGRTLMGEIWATGPLGESPGMLI